MIIFPVFEITIKCTDAVQKTWRSITLYMNVTRERMIGEIVIGVLAYTENIVMVIGEGETELRQSSDLKFPLF